MAIHDHAGSNSCPDACVEHVLMSASCTPQTLGESGGVRVIVKSRLDAVAPVNFGHERKIFPARNVRRVQHDSGSRIERSGSADPDGSAKAFTIFIEKFIQDEC